MKRLILTPTIVASLASLLLTALGQSAPTSATQQPLNRGKSITGRVVNDSGQPMPNARVIISGSSRQGVRRTISTDETGRFVADDLPRGSYAIVAQTNGYVLVREPGDTVHHRPGDSVNLVLRKGGAITGTVTNSDGNPVVGIQMSATLLRDERGRRNEATYGSSRYTDDRGVYRLFGLPAGTYIVAAASKNVGSFMVTTAYADDSPTYYPSSTRDTASEVALQWGAEASGINIRHRGVEGLTISGAVIDASSTEPLQSGISVLLFRSSSDTLEAQAGVQPNNSKRTFELNGVPDGDYYLTARRVPFQGDDGAASKRVPVKVRGRDITGVGISLIPLGSIAGRLTIDLATKDLRCDIKPAPAVEETLMSISADETDNSDPSSRFSSALYTPDNKGEFVFQGLPAGRYRLDSRVLLDEAWYVRGMTVPGPTNTPVDVSSSGISVKSGQRLNGVRLVLGEGAASIRGRVSPEKEGASLPDRLRVHLVPAEPNAADQTLRFIETEVQSDGSFRLLNAAPGRYWLHAQPLSEEDLKRRIPQAKAWNPAFRAALRRDAAASNIVIELKPCQRISEYQLVFRPKDAPVRSLGVRIQDR